MAPIILNVGYLLAASVGARALGIVKSFWLARILVPADYGALVFILLLTAYAPIFALGTVETMLKRVPFHNGRGEPATAAEIERGTFTFICLVAVFFALLAVPVGIFLRGTAARYVLPTRLMLVSISFSVFTAFSIHRLEAYKGFDRVGVITTVRAATVLPLQVVLGLRWGLTGAILGYLFSEALVCGWSLWVCRSLPSTLGFAAKRGLFGLLIRTGMPITIVWWTYIIQTTVDRLFIMGGMGDAATGYYGVGMSLAAAYLILPEAVAQVLYPSVSERYGQTGSAADLSPLVVGPTRMMGLVFPFFTFALLLVMPAAFRLLLPAYLPGLAAAQVLVVGALFSGLMRTGANLLVSVDRQRLLLWLVIGALALNIGGNVVVLWLHLGITGIATSTAVSSACLTVAVWYAVSAALGAPRRGRLRGTASLFAPALLFTVLFLAGDAVQQRLRGGGTSAVVVIAALALYAAVLAALPGSRREIAGFPRLVREGVAARARKETA